MVIRHASLPISAIFENIEQAADQEEAINAYIRGPLWRFLNWYNKNDFYELSTVLDYKPEQWPDAQIVSYLSELEGLSTYPVFKQKDIRFSHLYICIYCYFVVYFCTLYLFRFANIHVFRFI